MTLRADKTETYRDWEISPALVSYSPATDWYAAHRDFDGAPDANDNRCLYGPSPKALKEMIDVYYLEEEDA